MARRIVGTRGLAEVWETPILANLEPPGSHIFCVELGLRYTVSKAQLHTKTCVSLGVLGKPKSESPRPPPELSSPRFYVPRRGT